MHMYQTPAPYYTHCPSSLYVYLRGSGKPNWGVTAVIPYGKCHAEH